ncbi:MAG: DNA methyltransferase, partial [Marmoricola sp.]
PRLRLARNLLREDGVGFVSIDRNEVARLTLLLEEVFGAGNVVAQLVWVSNLKGRQMSDGGPAGTHEYILCFARNASAISQFRGSAAEFKELMPAVYKPTSYAVKHDTRGAYVTKNELHNTNSRFNEQTAPTMVFRIHVHPGTGETRVSDVDDETTYDGFVTVIPHANARPDVQWHAWRWSRAKVLAEHDDLEIELDGETPRIWTKVRDVDGMALKDLIIGPSTSTGQADLAALGLGQLFETPKPVSLLETLIAATTSEDDLVLDFFAGSGATAHAVMARNHRDGGRRRFVLVQLDEPCAPGSAAAKAGFATIGGLGRERVRRAGAALQADGYVGDVGFRALSLADGRAASRAAEADQERLFGRVAEGVEELVVAALLKHGVDLTLPWVRDGEVVQVGELLFSTSASDAVLDCVAERAPAVVVLAESAFTDDAHRLNTERILRERAPGTTMATI